MFLLFYFILLCLHMIEVSPNIIDNKQHFFSSEWVNPYSFESFCNFPVLIFQFICYPHHSQIRKSSHNIRWCYSDENFLLGYIIFYRDSRFYDNIILDDFALFIFLSIYATQTHSHGNQWLGILIWRMCHKKGSWLCRLPHHNFLIRLFRVAYVLRDVL